MPSEMKVKSTMGLFPLDDAWILIYPNPEDEEHIIREHYDRTDQGIIELLYAIKESCLHHYNSKHNEENIVIKIVKVKK
jgi:hypothetical protein